PLQVVGVVDVGMVGIVLDEAVRCGDGERAVTLLEMAVGDLELRLLGEPPVRKARLQFLEVLDRLCPFLAGHGVLRLAVESLRRPAGGFVVFLPGKDAAAREKQGKKQEEKRGDKWGEKRGSK